SDFILRSSDSVDFHVHRDMLRLLSDVFDGMFSLPATDQEPQRDGKIVLVVPEPANVLYRLLSFAHPAPSVRQYTLTLADLDEIVAVHNAARKYQFLRGQKLLEEVLDDRALLDAQPYRLYAIAQVCGLPALARKAALFTL
ncbi:hypothetical protein C8R43DRAFT_827497, partial [Mycena crocata]